jgi:hypothetical protein
MAPNSAADSGIDEGLIGNPALDPCDRVEAGAHQQEPHERPGNPAEQPALLAPGADQIPGHDSMHRSEAAHVGPTAALSERAWETEK